MDNNSKKFKKPIIYASILIGVVILFIFASILFIMISTGSIVAGDLASKFAANDNPYELILNEEIFLQLEKHNVGERVNKVSVPRIIKITIEEILAYYNIKDEVLDYETGKKVMMWDYVNAVDLVEPMVIYLKTANIKVDNEGKIMEDFLRLPAVQQFIIGLSDVEEVTEADIQEIVYRPTEEYEFYLPGTGGALGRLEGFVKLESGSYVENSAFYYKFYDMKRRILNVTGYYQAGQIYSDHPFPSNDNCGDPTSEGHASIGGSACGPMSFATVVSYYKKTYNTGKFPNGIIEADPVLKAQGFYLAEVEEVVYDFCKHHPKGAGTSMFGVSKNIELQEMYGVYFVGVYGSGLAKEGVKSMGSLVAFSNWIYEQISNDHPIIFLARGSENDIWKDNPAARMAFTMYHQPYFEFTSGGHYFVCNGYDINGNLILTDPARPRLGESFMYPWKEALNQVMYAWVFASLAEKDLNGTEETFLGDYTEMVEENENSDNIIEDAE